MDPIQHNRQIRSLIQQGFKMLYSLFLRQIQPEFLLNLLVDVAVFDIGDVGIDHEGYQVENEVGALSQDAKGGEAEIFEAGVVG